MAAQQPTRCPSCGAQLATMRLNLTQSMPSCTGSSCLWPLDADCDVDTFIIGAAPVGAAAAAGGAVASVAASEPRKRKRKRREASNKQPLAQRATAAGSAEGRASPAASPIRSPEFAAAQDWSGISEDVSCKPSDAGSMLPMLRGARASSQSGPVLSPVLSPRPACPPAALEGGGALEPLQCGGGVCDSLQATLDELDTFLAADAADML